MITMWSLVITGCYFSLSCNFESNSDLINILFDKNICIAEKTLTGSDNIKLSAQLLPLSSVSLLF